LEKNIINFKTLTGKSKNTDLLGRFSSFPDIFSEFFFWNRTRQRTKTKCRAAREKS